MEAQLATDGLDSEGMGFDFVAVKRILGELAARFDHRDINAVPPFDRLSPTTERIAAWFYESLKEQLPEAPLAAVTVWEGADCDATFAPDGEGGFA